MKKLYSFVLMAMMLLIGTNVKAAPFYGSTWGELQDAIYAIMSDDNVTSGEITLTQDVNLQEGKTIWVGTKDLNGAYKSITINLNGHNITMNGVLDSNSKRKQYVMFALTHGELKVINNSATEAVIQFTGTTGDNSRIFAVYGSYRSSRWNEDGDALVADSINTRAQGWFSHLEIGTNVKLYGGPDCLVEGIAICSDLASKYYKDSENQETLSYTTKIFTTSSHGFAQGVRVDFNGKIELVGDNSGKIYGISTKGTVRSSLNADPNKPTSENPEKIQSKFLSGNDSIAYLYHYYEYNDSIHKADNGKTHKLDTLDAPFIWVQPNAEINVRNEGSKVAGIYAAGYAKWLVQGYVAGKTGFYVSSGTVDLIDAYVKSTADTWTSTSNAGSANGGGSGVVINSRDAYSGGVDFAVAGDTKIESIGGYAIEEAVNTSPTKENPDYDSNDPNSPKYIADTKVSSVKIETGTIVGGEKGAIIIADATATAAAQASDPTTVVVYGGNVTGDTKVGTDGDLNTLLPTTEEYYTTTVTVGTQTVVVVNKGNVSNIHDAAAIASASDSIRWTGTSETLYADKALDYVEMNQNGAQILIIGDPENEDADKRFVTFTVGRVIMDADAQIIVMPGSRLIINGKDGIVAPSVSNILLKNQGALNAADRMHAHFLVSPETSGNRHPNATVELASYAWRNNSSEYQWERFGIPTHNALKSVECVENAVTTRFNEFTDNWYDIGYLNKAGVDHIDPKVLNTPFRTYALLAGRDNSDLANTAPKYTFAGELLGNDDASLTVNLLWTPFTNSYSAEVDLKKMLEVVENAQVVDPFVYFATLNGYGSYIWEGVDTEAINEDGAIAKLSPMQAFILKKKTAMATQVEAIPLNYKNMVYDPTIASLNGAPARHAKANDYTAHMRIHVANEFTWDNVVLRETTTDVKAADKYMNDDLNIYAMSENNACIYAAEDLENTYLGVSTVKGGDFTMSFANVNGREFDLIDLETGAKVAASEGATYQFHLNANTVADYRFKLVERQNAPTAIENTEAVKSVSGIYTITGQYVGEMNVWNTLPAGVYVVNGAKCVK